MVGARFSSSRPESEHCIAISHICSMDSHVLHMWQTVHLKQCYILEAIGQVSAHHVLVQRVQYGTGLSEPSPQDAYGSQHSCSGVEPWWACVVAAVIQNLSTALPSHLSTDSHVFHMWQVVHLKQCYMLSALLEKRSVGPGQVSDLYALFQRVRGMTWAKIGDGFGPSVWPSIGISQLKMHRPIMTKSS